MRGAIELARAAVAADPDHVEALELLGTMLVTRRRAFDEGLETLERMIALRDGDAGLWYTVGWCYEFAAHESRRRPSRAPSTPPRSLYERAAEAFRTCLSLNPEGKLEGDAEDLLDHVENELASM